MDLAPKKHDINKTIDVVILDKISTLKSKAERNGGLGGS